METNHIYFSSILEYAYVSENMKVAMGIEKLMTPRCYNNKNKLNGTSK